MSPLNKILDLLHNWNVIYIYRVVYNHRDQSRLLNPDNEICIMKWKDNNLWFSRKDGKYNLAFLCQGLNK